MNTPYLIINYVHDVGITVVRTRDDWEDAKKIAIEMAAEQWDIVGADLSEQLDRNNFIGGSGAEIFICQSAD
jgi:hypothetical protein